MKMAMRQGRSFDESDKTGAEPVIIVNEPFARRNFAGAAPLDQRLCVACEKYGDPSMRRVIGVVNETRQRSLAELPPATVFIPLTQVPEEMRGVLRQASFVVRSAGDPFRHCA